jgi:hypothetical protein
MQRVLDRLVRYVAAHAIVFEPHAVEDAAEAYDTILNRPKECLGVLLRYG